MMAIKNVTGIVKFRGTSLICENGLDKD